MEVRAPELALERLQPVVAGEPAAEAHADLAEGEVDLVVQHEDPVQVEVVGAAGRPGGPAGLVHVRLRLEQRDARAARTRAALRQLARVLLLRPRQVPAPRQRVGDLEADVVRRLGVAGARVAEPDHKPVDRRRGEELQDSSPESAADCPASSAVSPSAWPSAASPTSSVSVSISSSTGSAVGGVIEATTVSGSSSSVTPFGGVIDPSVSVAFISRPETSCWIVSGMSPGSASTFSSRVSCVSTPPSTVPGASSAPTRSSTTVV